MLYYEYIEESNGNKYLTLVPTDESKDILEKKSYLSKILLGQTIMMRNK